MFDHPRLPLETAIEQFLEAAAGGDREAQEVLATAYLREGRREQAIEWYERAADNGSFDAAYSMFLAFSPLLQSYLDGDGVQKDEMKARKYADLAKAMVRDRAEKGDPLALARMSSVFLAVGDLQGARPWLERQVFNMGYQDPLYQLAKAYDEAGEAAKAKALRDAVHRIEDVAFDRV